LISISARRHSGQTAWMWLPKGLTATANCRDGFDLRAGRQRSRP
jgi:hypothetical protein